MVFNSNKGFFLTLDDSAKPATLDLPQKESQPEESSAPEVKADADSALLTSAAAPAEPPSVAAQATTESKADAATASQGSMTTAEAIAAELAEAEAARPAVNYSTFAPDNLAPGAGLSRRSRRPGAALQSFRGIAKDLFKS